MRTIVEINGTAYEVVPQRYGDENWVVSCDLCDFQEVDEEGRTYCSVVGVFDCRAYDTNKYSVHLRRIATPSIGLNTPSEARREAADYGD